MLLMVGAYLVATEFGPRILSTHFGAWSIFFVSYMGVAQKYVTHLWGSI